MTPDEIERGIAAYAHEREVLRRLLRRGPLHQDKFDRLFRRFRRGRARALSGDTFILGLGVNGGNAWAVSLELLQLMCFLGEAVSERGADGKIIYRLAKEKEHDHS